MKVNVLYPQSRIIGCLLVTTILSWSSAQAAEAIRWVDLPKAIGHGKVRSDNREDRQYRVVTKAGRTYAGRELYFSPHVVSVAPSGLAILREQVAEIRIRSDDRRWKDALVAPGGAVFDSICSGGDSYCFPVGPVLLLFPVAIAATALAAPFTLSIEGIRRLLPDRVVKVAP